jgi:hypothetical protein
VPFDDIQADLTLDPATNEYFFDYVGEQSVLVEHVCEGDTFMDWEYFPGYGSTDDMLVPWDRSSVAIVGGQRRTPSPGVTVETTWTLSPMQ